MKWPGVVDRGRVHCHRHMQPPSRIRCSSCFSLTWARVSSGEGDNEMFVTANENLPVRTSPDVGRASARMTAVCHHDGLGCAFTTDNGRKSPITFQSLTEYNNFVSNIFFDIFRNKEVTDQKWNIPSLSHFIPLIDQLKPNISKTV